MLRVKRTMAELLADVPSVAQEIDVLCLELRRIGHLPNVLVDIVADYSTVKWHDELMIVWRIASTKAWLYRSFHELVRSYGASAFHDLFYVMNAAIGSSNVTENAISGFILNSTIDDRAIVRSLARDIAAAYSQSQDQYKMDTYVLDAVHRLLLAIDRVASR